MCYAMLRENMVLCLCFKAEMNTYLEVLLRAAL